MACAVVTGKKLRRQPMRTRKGRNRIQFFLQTTGSGSSSLQIVLGLQIVLPEVEFRYEHDHTSIFYMPSTDQSGPFLFENNPELPLRVLMPKRKWPTTVCCARDEKQRSRVSRAQRITEKASTAFYSEHSPKAENHHAEN